MKTGLKRIILSLFVLFAIKEANCIETFVQKGAFLSKGIIYSYDFIDKTKSILINTTDSIQKYIVSPDHRYVAYETYYKHIKSAGIYENEEDRPFVPINSIVIWDLKLMKKVKEIEPEKNGLFHVNIEKWIDNDVLLFGDCGHFDFSGYVTYTINSGIKEFGYTDQQMYDSHYIALDKASEVFMDNRNRLNIVDRNQRNDTLLFELNKKVSNIYVSPKKTYFVWTNYEKYFDIDRLNYSHKKNINLHFLKNDSTYIIHSIKKTNEKGKGSGYINFSMNGNYIGIGETNKFYIYELLSGESKVVDGYNFTWISDYKLVFNKEGNLYTYNTITSRIKLLTEEACCFKVIKYAR